MKKISFLAVILLLSVSAFAILPPKQYTGCLQKDVPQSQRYSMVAG